MKLFSTHILLLVLPGCFYSDESTVNETNTIREGCTRQNAPILDKFEWFYSQPVHLRALTAKSKLCVACERAPCDNKTYICLHVKGPEKDRLRIISYQCIKDCFKFIQEGAYSILMVKIIILEVNNKTNLENRRILGLFLLKQTV